MFRIAALVEKATMHPRMQSLNPPFEHFRKCGETGNLPHRDFFFSQQLRGAAGRDDVHALVFKRARERRDAGLIGNGDEGAGDFHEFDEAMKS